MMLTSQTASAAPGTAPELELIDTSGNQVSMPITSPSAASPGDTGMDHGAGSASEHGSDPAPMPEMTGMSPEHGSGDMPEMSPSEHGSGDMPGMSPSEHGSGDMPGMNPSEHGSGDMPGMNPSEHGSGDMPGMSPSEHGSGDMPGMSPSEHGSGDMPGMSGHGASEKAAEDRPLAPVLGTFGGGAAAVMLTAGFMRRKDRAELEAKTTARAERRAKI
jgi:hypothetical protein